MSREFQPTKRSNPCPICTDTTGDCRITGSGNILCHTYAYEGETQGWRYIKTVDPAPWGLYVPIERYAYGSDSLTEIVRKSRREKEHDVQQQKAALPPQKFHQIFTNLKTGAGLDAHHRADLQRRGFSSEEIDHYGFFSVEPNQHAGPYAHWAFPGINQQDYFRVAGSGYTVPFFNHQGLIHGYQIRLDNVDSGKYRWAKSTLSSHIPVDGELELPLTYIPGKGTTVGLVEGGLKAILAAKRLGIPIIGAAAGQFSNSPNQLQEMLIGATEVIIYPDAGDVINENVMKRWHRQVETLSKLGVSIKIAWWNQETKLTGDIDEIGEEIPIKLIQFNEFLEISRKAQHRHTVKKEQLKLRTLTVPAVHNYSDRYLKDLKKIAPLSGIVAIKSPKGTGKSVQIKNLIERAKVKGMNVISITPRIALGREQALKWDLHWFNDTSDPNLSRHPSGKLKFTVGVCWDSLWRFAELSWENTLIIIDEAELAAIHLMLSSTCREKRPKILKTVKEKFRECLESGGCLVLADADLSDVSLSYFSSLSPKSPITLIKNNPPQENPWEVLFWTGRRDDALKQLFNRLEIPVKDGQIERNRRIAVATDSKDEAQAIETALLERYPQLNCVRIDSTTTETELGRAFVERPNESIQNIQPQVLIYTSSMGVGVSIDVPWFDEVYGFFFGVTEPSQARQMLARIRQNVPRTIWAKHNGNLKTTPTFLPHQVKDNLISHHRETTILLDVVQAIAGENASDKTLMDIYQQIWDPTTQSWDNLHLDCYANLIARRDYGIVHYAQILLEELESEGHQIIHCGKGDKTHEGQQVAAVKKEIPKQEAMAISQAKDISLETAKMLQRKITITEEERKQIIKAMLRAELPGVELTPEFIHKAVTGDQRSWLNAVKMYWYCTHPNEVVEKDRQTWLDYLYDFSDGAVYLADIKTFSLQATCLRDLKLLELIDLEEPNKLYRHDSPEIQTIYLKARRNYRLKTAFNMTITRKATPIYTVNRLLEKIGLKLKFVKEDKDKVRLYQLDTSLLNDPHRLAVLESLTIKAEQRHQEKEFAKETITQENITEKIANQINQCQLNSQNLSNAINEAIKLIQTTMIHGPSLWAKLSVKVKELVQELCPQEYRQLLETLVEI